MAVSTNGQMIATGLPPQHPGFVQNIKGGPIQAAVEKTMSARDAQAAHAKMLGATIRGGRRRRRGGGVAEFKALAVPEAGSIQGVSANKNMASLMQGLANINAGKTYDHLVDAQPYKVGGRRRKHLRKTRKNGSRNSRSSHRNTSKRHSRSRRNRRVRK